MCGVLSPSMVIELCMAKSEERHWNCDEPNPSNVVYLNLELQGIAKIRGLYSFTNLTQLKLNNNNIEDLNAYFKTKSTDSIHRYYDVKEELKTDGELDDVKNETKPFQRSKYSLTDLHYDLMKFETELEDQLEENMGDFERTLSGLIDEFLQAIDGEVAICREAEDEYYKKVSNHCLHLLDKVPLEEMGVEVTPQLREMFEDKESLTEALADSYSSILMHRTVELDKVSIKTPVVTCKPSGSRKANPINGWKFLLGSIV
ncbi:Dynein regulatory complex subunit 3 [Taenia crassiceps]|uniref:Dynein regulatory complex subunit 3 n=1 Tax=Taenia crassiceps TaxID=6207 RepID=A0ABR4QDH4_9CEST